MRHEPSPINICPAAWTAAMTASTVTVAHIRPSWSIPPISGDSAVIWTVALKRLAPRTLLLTVDWRRTRSPVKRPDSRSAWTASDPLKGMRKESLRTVRNPRTAYTISCMNIVSAAARPPGLPPGPLAAARVRTIALQLQPPAGTIAWGCPKLADVTWGFHWPSGSLEADRIGIRGSSAPVSRFRPAPGGTDPPHRATRALAGLLGQRADPDEGVRVGGQACGVGWR